MNRYVLIWSLSWVFFVGIHATPPINLNAPLTSIAFGSCNRYDEDQSIWKSILRYSPQLWVWLGDVSYNDEKKYVIFDTPATEEQMKERYALVKENKEYKTLTQTVPITGIWDDHDYGMNDGDKTFSLRKQSQQHFLSFLDEPQDSPRWKRKGIYTSFNIGPPGKRVKLILLDTRSLRTPQKTALEGGDILGEAQWEWLEKELISSDAQIHLIFSGTQIIPNDKPIREKWANYPKSRERFFALLENVKPPGTVLFSGDIHYGEISKKDCIGLGYPIYEITSSGLTHCCEQELSVFCGILLKTLWKSKYQVGGAYPKMNFGTLRINWNVVPAVITTDIRSSNGSVVMSISFPIGEPAIERKDCVAEEPVSEWILLPKKALFKKTVVTISPFLLAILLVGLSLCLIRKRNK